MIGGGQILSTVHFTEFPYVNNYTTYELSITNPSCTR